MHLSEWGTKQTFYLVTDRSHPKEKFGQRAFDPTPKRNMVKEPWIPPRRKFKVGEYDSWQILIDLDGSYPKGNFRWENRMEGKNWSWPKKGWPWLLRLWPQSSTQTKKTKNNIDNSNNNSHSSMTCRVCHRKKQRNKVKVIFCYYTLELCRITQSAML